MHGITLWKTEHWIKSLAFLSLVVFFGLFIFFASSTCGCGNTAKAQETKATADIDGMITALRTFAENNGRYPTTDEGLQALVSNPGNLEHWERTLDNAVPTDPWGHPYIYRSPSINGKPFDLLSSGPDGQEGTADDLSN